MTKLIAMMVQKRNVNNCITQEHYQIQSKVATVEYKYDTRWWKPMIVDEKCKQNLCKNENKSMRLKVVSHKNVKITNCNTQVAHFNAKMIHRNNEKNKKM